MVCRETVYNFCNEHKVQSCNLLLAVSGGSDSVALFHIFQSLKARLDINDIGVVHINHGLRGNDSDTEAAFVANLAQKGKSRFHYKKLSRKTLEDSGIENWARRERYAFYSELQHRFGYRYIATGHTLNDQAETFLMRLMRGSGLKGLGAIVAVRTDGVIRPLISLEKDFLRAWLVRHGYRWYEDSTNSDTRYKRNWIRHVIIPGLCRKEPHTLQYLSKLCSYLQKQYTFYEILVNKWLQNHLVSENEFSMIIRKPQHNHSDFLIKESIASLLRKHSISFDQKHIAMIVDVFGKESGCFLLRDNWRIFPMKDTVRFELHTPHQKPGTPYYRYKITLSGVTQCGSCGYEFYAEEIRDYSSLKYGFEKSNWTVFLDYDKIGEVLYFRSIKNTDTFQQLGSDQKHPVVKYLKRQQINAYARQRTGVCTTKWEEIAWIPGVAVGHRFRITESTQRVIKICCKIIS